LAFGSAAPITVVVPLPAQTTQQPQSQQQHHDN
jgi:hypothetical protein